MGGVLTGGREACVAFGPNVKPVAHLVAEISAETSFPIVTVCWGPSIGFRCEPAVHPDQTAPGISPPELYSSRDVSNQTIQLQ